MCLAGGLASAGCAGHYLLAPNTASIGSGVAWFEPTVATDVRTLERWRSGVGPPIVSSAVVTSDRPIDRLTIVSWNTAVGDADVIAFVRALRTSIGPDAPVVLLLQEAYRKDSTVPHLLPVNASFAGRLGELRQGRPRDDVRAIADATGMSAYYVPSMRNGSPLVSDEDRGNAILASIPITRLSAIELPFEQQRRVAVAASVGGVTSQGRRWDLRVVSAHLDNMVGGRRLWVAGSEYARTRQARALVSHLSDTSPAVLAGDFNTWFGFRDRAYLETARAFPGAPPSDRRATFHGLLRLDHVFLRLPTLWHAASRRGNDRFGSDHFPLITTIDIR
jgi:endonuclease/exonuclease/phosphatase family metal-dependent hydrolase